MEYDREKIFVLRAKLADQNAKRMQEPSVKVIMAELAELYRHLARQVKELAELRKSARKP